MRGRIRREPEELIGQRFGKIVVTKISVYDTKHLAWKAWCLCDCGVKKEKWVGDIKQGKTRSCGCGVTAATIARSTTHGKKGTKVYRAWRNMLERCFRESNRYYKDYGGRGITVCTEWLTFENFYRDMGDPTPGSSLDRKDVNGNYCSANCRWASASEQANNKRNTVRLTFQERTMTVKEWSSELGISANIIYSRMSRDLPLEWTLYPGDLTKGFKTKRLREQVGLRSATFNQIEGGFHV